MHVDEWPTGRVVLPTFGNKSRKTSKSYPSTGDQFCESRKTAKFDSPVGLLGRVSRTWSNYDSLEETQWSCASFGQRLGTNREKRLSLIRLRGISFENREKRQSSTRRSVFSGVCRARGVTTTLSRKSNGRARHLANFRKIEENDKVRSVYRGSLTKIYHSNTIEYHWIPLNTIQYHWTIQWYFSRLNGTLGYSMVFLLDSMVLWMVIRNTIQDHWTIQWYILFSVVFSMVFQNTIEYHWTTQW